MNTKTVTGTNKNCKTYKHTYYVKVRQSEDDTTYRLEVHPLKQYR